MATAENVGGYLSLIASADLSSYQYHAVKIDTSGYVALCGDGELAVGILQDAPDTAGDICQVAPLNGRKLKAVVGTGGITAGDDLGVDASGHLVAAATGDQVVGVALETAAAGAIAQFIALSSGNAD